MTQSLAERIRNSTEDQWPALNRELAIALDMGLLEVNFLNANHETGPHVAECLRREWVCTASQNLRRCVVCLSGKIVSRDDTQITLAFAEALARAVEGEG